MRSFEIFIEPQPSSLAHDAPKARAPAHDAPERQPRKKASEVLDLFIHGANVTARVSERHASLVLRDLAWALVELVPVARGKRIVRFYEDAWELCVERLGESATLSIYRGGPSPTVLVYDRHVVWDEMCASVLDALVTTSERRTKDALGGVTDLREAHRVLGRAIAEHPAPIADVPGLQSLEVEIDRDAPLSFAAEFAMRPGPTEDDEEANVERADLHALLVRGKMRAEVRGRSVDLGEAYPFLFAEGALDLVKRALDAWERGQAFFARGASGGVLLGLRTMAVDLPGAALTLGPATPAAPPSRDGGARVIPFGREAHPSERGGSTFPELPLFDVVEAVLAFGRSLVRALVRRDRTQGQNLRLAAFRRDLRATGDALREVRRKDVRINHAPESYRAFASQTRAKAPGETLGATRLRYTQRWRALVPGIDLRATFLCGDRIVIGAAAETYCLDRASGELLWRKDTGRAVNVVTPSGIARIAPDGAIAIHDYGSGEVTLRTWIAPRTAGPCAGAVVSTSGLPRLLIVTEGDKHLVALDLTSGEARWRYAWGRSRPGAKSAGSEPLAGALRLKRAGKLLYVASGDSALTAVDVQTGAVVWRVRDRLRFRFAPTVDHDQLFALAGGAGSAASLHAIDPYSGRISWTSKLPTSPCTVEGGPLLSSASVAVAVRDRRGLRLAAFHRETGAPLFHSEPIAPVGTSWLAVDDLLVGNTPSGDVLGVCAAKGTIRWKHALGGGLESDVPRRLEPVLRSGALFVPHTDVQVFRPSDGTHLGTVGPCDAIPDLLRVDERCDVYAAEESGHMVAFGVGPRLSLVR